MKNKIIIGLSLILSVVIFGFIAKPDEPVMYDYVQIMQRGKHIGVSTIRGYETSKTDNNDEMDATSVLILIEDYQRNGYEVYSHSGFGAGPYIMNSFLLRKKR